MENHDREGKGGKNANDGKHAGRESGLRVTIHVEPEPLDDSQAPPIPFARTPIRHDEVDADYDPYGVRPRPEDIPFDEPAWTIAWESPTSPLPLGDCLPGRCSCGGTLPPGKWIDTDPASYVEDATRYPMADEDPDESPAA